MTRKTVSESSRVSVGDFQSARSMHPDGQMHVAGNKISRACVCDYYGSELIEYLPDLDPNRVYRLYRDPAELEKAAHTFDLVPLLDRHTTATPDDPQLESVVGAVGSGVRFDGEYLIADLCFWTEDAIQGVTSGDTVELSCGYSFSVDMQSGITASGEAFDGRMCDIIGNHVALVTAGRCGPSVRVNDEAPKMPEVEVEIKPEGELPEESKAKAEDEENEEAKAEDEAESMTPAKAYDEAAIIKKMEAKFRELRIAETAVEPIVGRVQAMDSAEQVYRYALDKVGVEHKGINDVVALKAMVSMAAKMQATTEVESRAKAGDALPVGAKSSFSEMYPTAGKVSVLG